MCRSGEPASHPCRQAWPLSFTCQVLAQRLWTLCRNPQELLGSLHETKQPGRAKGTQKNGRRRPGPCLRLNARIALAVGLEPWDLLQARTISRGANDSLIYHSLFGRVMGNTVRMRPRDAGRDRDWGRHRAAAQQSAAAGRSMERRMGQ